MTLIDATPSDPAMVFAADPSVKMMSLVTMLAVKKDHSAISGRSLLSTACPPSKSHETVDIVFVLSMRDTYWCCFFICQTSFELYSLCLVNLGKSKDRGQRNSDITYQVAFDTFDVETTHALIPLILHFISQSLMRCSQNKFEQSQPMRLPTPYLKNDL